MNTVRTKSIQLPDITVSDEDLNDITMVSPIDFISEEQNKKIFERVKDGLKNINNPERWLTREECMKLAKERFNI